MKKIKDTTQPFIFTKDKEASELLKSQGFTLFMEGNEAYMFINTGKLIFTSKEDENKYKNKIIYTKKLCI